MPILALARKTTVVSRRSENEDSEALASPSLDTHRATVDLLVNTQPPTAPPKKDLVAVVVPLDPSKEKAVSILRIQEAGVHGFILQIPVFTNVESVTIKEEQTYAIVKYLKENFTIEYVKLEPMAHSKKRKNGEEERFGVSEAALQKLSTVSVALLEFHFIRLLKAAGIPEKSLLAPTRISNAIRSFISTGMTSEEMYKEFARANIGCLEKGSEQRTSRSKKANDKPVAQVFSKDLWKEHLQTVYNGDHRFTIHDNETAETLNDLHLGYLQDDLDFIGTLALIQRSDKRVPVFKALKPIYPEKVYEENRPFVLAAIAFLNGKKTHPVEYHSINATSIAKQITNTPSFGPVSFIAEPNRLTIYFLAPGFDIDVIFPLFCESSFGTPASIHVRLQTEDDFKMDEVLWNTAAIRERAAVTPTGSYASDREKFIQNRGFIIPIPTNVRFHPKYREAGHRGLNCSGVGGLFKVELDLVRDFEANGRQEEDEEIRALKRRRTENNEKKTNAV